ncbi:MAG: OmpA family protein [Chitinophagaceae bacterium]
MARKKYGLMLGLLGGLATTTAMAQDSTSSSTSDDWLWDSSKVSSSKLAQHNAWVANETPYPAKPKNMWELGIGVGPTLAFTPIDPQIGYGASLSLRKAISHIFSIRGQYNYGIYKGLDYRARSASYLPSSIAAAYRANGGSSYVANFKAVIQQASVDLIASLNSISSYRGNPKLDVYLLAGYSLVWGNSSINLYNSSGGLYSWASDADNTRIDKATAKDALKSGQSSSFLSNKSGDDQQYETSLSSAADGHNQVFGGSGSTLKRHGADFGGGVAFKVSKHFNIGVEQKFTYVFDNGDFSGIKTSSAKNTLLSNTQVRFNFNLGSSAKRVEPLWWINPNNYIYNELNIPRHMKITLPDADGDGVTDALDQEPNTPAGAPVDAHGRALDTDGDGVPDYKDKQKITPPSWFPVDADGVGTEPEPACCKELRDKIANLQVAPKNECAITSLPSVQFTKGSVKLSKAAQASLASVAAQLNANPSCKAKVIGYGASNKKAQQLSWDRVNSVIKYLVEKQGISESRLLFYYGQDGDANTVDLQGTTEEGPNTVPAPHPNLQKSN